MKFLRKNIVMTAILAVAAVVAVRLYLSKRSLENTVESLHEEAAASAKTIEEKDGLYSKATLKIKNLENMLSAVKDVNSTQRDVIDSMVKLIKQRDEKIVSLTNIAVKWKEAYEAAIKASQSEEEPTSESPPGTTVRKRVDFEDALGPFDVKGYTLTDPPYAWLKVTQRDPFNLTIALTQARDKSWRTYVTSDSGVQVDIKVAAVDPYVTKRKWYEDVRVGAFGTTDMLGAFATVPFGSFDVGPLVGATVGDGSDVAYGAIVSYRLFSR